MYGVQIWGPIVAQAAASYLSNRGKASNETELQRTKRHLVDELLASLNGKGRYSDLYKFDKHAFNKSFVEPMKAKFRNQIAPQIQQEYIASGQQRGTGLDDQLLRAGVDLDNMLNQYYYQAQQDAMNRKQNAINSILGGGNGAANDTSAGQDIMSGLSGYLSSSGFSDSLTSMFGNNNNNNANSTANTTPIQGRRGFESDDYTWA